MLSADFVIATAIVNFPLYQRIVNEFPEDKAIWLTVARAYRNDPHYFTEAVDTYQTLLGKYPDDDMIQDTQLSIPADELSAYFARVGTDGWNEEIAIFPTLIGCSDRLLTCLVGAIQRSSH